MYYQIKAQVAHVTKDGWSSSVGIPTFFLRDDIQMIPNAKDAIHVALAILAHLTKDPTAVSICISACSETGEDYYTETSNLKGF